MTVIPKGQFRGELFACGHPKWTSNTRTTPGGYEQCFGCYRVRLVVGKHKKECERKRGLTVGQRVALGLI